MGWFLNGGDPPLFDRRFAHFSIKMHVGGTIEGNNYVGGAARFVDNCHEDEIGIFELCQMVREMGTSCSNDYYLNVNGEMRVVKSDAEGLRMCPFVDENRVVEVYVVSNVVDVIATHGSQIESEIVRGNKGKQKGKGKGKDKEESIIEIHEQSSDSDTDDYDPDSMSSDCDDEDFQESDGGLEDDDLPKAVAMTLNQGTVVKSMDFHPVQQILLLVGTNTGEITLWELGSRERLAVRSFDVWEFGKCSMPLQASLANDYTAAINLVIWSPDGTLFGVAYSKHIVHVYSYHGGDDVRNHLEIEAHGGSVIDLGFSYPNKQLSIVTCGDDRAIKLQGLNSALLRVMKLLFIPCVPIIKKTADGMKKLKKLLGCVWLDSLV